MNHPYIIGRGQLPSDKMRFAPHGQSAHLILMAYRGATANCRSTSPEA